MMILQNILLAVLFIAVTGASAVCDNGGTVLNGSSHPKCRCPPGFKGYKCDQQVTPCEGKPCRNDATCKELNGGTFQCLCSSLYTGLLCEKRILPCDSEPCRNGGICSNNGLTCFKCKCPPGFKGSDCSDTIKPCETIACQNGGTCTDGKKGSFSCVCKKGFGGTLCKDALYGSEVLRDQDIQPLKGWLGIQRSWLLCYRASDNGWKSATFHKLCDNKGPTVTIVRVGDYIFGGYSDVKFGGTTAYRTSNAAFLFSFVNKDRLPPFKSEIYQHHNNAIYNNPSYGPTFGGGHDFNIRDDSHTTVGSYSNFGHTYLPPHGYVYTTTKAKSLLAGSYNFKPSELEVFYEI